MKKKKNAFTLIELLAIIVILAIIAVITVPIILNVIENAKKGSVIDSAYGYKDAVQNHCVSKSIINPNNETLTGVKNVSELETDGLTVSGEKPTEGWVQINKGKVVDYSLKFGDYVVSLDITTNNPVSTKSAELKEEPLPTMEEMCPGCVYGFQNNHLFYKGSAVPDGFSNDYTSLGNTFLGYIAENGVITRGFICGKQNGNYFCLEGWDTSKYDYNISIVNRFIANGEGMTCTTTDSGKYSCQDHTSDTHCDISTLRATVTKKSAFLFDDGLNCSPYQGGNKYDYRHCETSEGSLGFDIYCYEAHIVHYPNSADGTDL